MATTITLTDRSTGRTFQYSQALLEREMAFCDRFGVDSVSRYIFDCIITEALNNWYGRSCWLEREATADRGIFGRIGDFAPYGNVFITPRIQFEMTVNGQDVSTPSELSEAEPAIC